ncbi:MAG: hypothetical protein Q7S52_05835 [bacterium]|nr:hypothetical protein [bacterium]
MKNLVTKKSVLYISLVYAVFFAGVFFVGEICHSGWCRIRDDDFLGQLFFVLLPLLPVFVFSLITYWMREEVFRAWWNFARWFAPVIIVVTLLQNMQGGRGGGLGGVMSSGFDILVLGLFYTIFIIVSLWKIVRAYNRSKQAKE